MVNAMRLSIQYATLFAFMVFLLTQSVYGQSLMGSYLHIDYIKIEKEDVKPFHEFIQSTIIEEKEREIESEQISGWYLYKVAYPGTQNSTYNYVIVTEGNSVASFETDFEQQFSNHFETSFLTHPTHTELWRVRNSVRSQHMTAPSRYMVMNYMSVGLGYEYEYQMFEDEIALPIHKQRMERDMMNGWELNELLIPGGTEYGYNFSTIDYFTSLVHMEFGFTEELIRQTHPETNINEFFENIYRTRDLVRSEVWELIHAVE